MTARILHLAKFLLLALALPFVATSAFAQATRTWVSGVGDDANPCSRTAPCKTWAGAISKTAAGGEISALDPGGYGAVTITKSITLNGDGTLASILASGFHGIVVNAGANDVVIIRNVSIDGAGTAGGFSGIRFLAGGELHVERVTIYGMSGHGIHFLPSGASALHVDQATIRNTGLGAITVGPTGTGTAVASINRTAMSGNARGVKGEDGSTIVVRDSQATGNDANGFVAIGVSRAVNMTLESVVSAGNLAAGVYTGSNSMVKISNTTVTRNQDGILVVGGSLISFGNNRIYDNNFNNNPPSTSVAQQ